MAQPLSTATTTARKPATWSPLETLLTHWTEARARAKTRAQLRTLSPQLLQDIGLTDADAASTKAPLHRRRAERAGNW